MKDSWNGWGEEGGGPYLCVRGPNSLEQTAAQPFHCIDIRTIRWTRLMNS